MDPKDVHDQLDQVQLGDVRELEEREAGTVCRGGDRSATMAAFFTGRGYRVASLEGGMQAWAEAGLSVRTPDGERPGKVA